MNNLDRRTAFSPGEVVKFLAAYVHVSKLEKRPPCMLDTMAGFISNRILAKHLNAVTKLTDLAAVLECYAFFECNSLATIELLASSGYQLRLASASSIDLEKRIENEQDIIVEQQWLPALNSILRSHKILGYRPSNTTMVSLVPAVRFYAKHSRADDVRETVDMFEELQFHPGPRILDYLRKFY